MTKLDEKQIIEIFQSGFGNKNFVAEDAEIFKIGKGFGIVKTDTLVESTDIPPGMKLTEIARKSIVASISDFAAKGVQPLYCIISVSLPNSITKSKIIQLARGFKDASKEFGFKILGGDTNKAKEIVISVTLIGLTNRFVQRSGAQRGDVIVVSGPFGLTASGLKIILYGKKSRPEFKIRAKKAVFHPMPRLKFGTRSARLFSASMDSSDGLSTCLVEMARQSKKRFILTKIPSARGTEEFASSNRLDFLDLVFNGGEEYEIVATVHPKNLPKLQKVAKSQRVNLIEIGFVEEGSGVFLQNKTKAIRILDKGWSHFRD